MNNDHLPLRPALKTTGTKTKQFSRLGCKKENGDHPTARALNTTTTINKQHNLRK